MSYNGWKNKETWLVNLWLGGALCDDVENGVDVDDTYIESLVLDLVEDANINATFISINATFISDLLNCALSEIDYIQLAEHYDIEESDNV